MKNICNRIIKNGIFKTLLSFIVPTIISQIILVVYNAADTFFISKVGTEEMIAGVTICMPAFMFLSAISNLFGVGGSTLFTRKSETKSKEYLNSIFNFSFIFCCIVTIFYSIISYVFLNPFINLLGGKNTLVHTFSKTYLLYVVILFGIFSSLSILYSHFYRAVGKTTIASIGIAIGGLCNILLDFTFVYFIFKNNPVFGVALATVLSNAISLIYFIFVTIYLQDINKLFKFRLQKGIFKNNIPKKIILVGIPSCVMTLFENLSYAILGNLISYSGVSAQAGLGISKKINMLSHCTVRGISQGALPIMGYTYSVGNKQYVKKTIHYTLLLSFLCSSVISIIYFIFNTQIINLFIYEGNSFTYATTYLKILCLGAPFSAIAYVLISYFQSFGKWKESFLIAILRKGLLDIPLMIIIFNVTMNSYLLVGVTPLVDIICCSIAVILYFSTKKVVNNKISRKKEKYISYLKTKYSG